MSDEKTTVIIVTEARSERDCRYDANQAEVTDDLVLRLLRKGRDVGGYQPDGWLSWREDGATVPDTARQQLARANRALRDIANLNTEDGMDVNDAVAVARKAADEIAELDL